MYIIQIFYGKMIFLQKFAMPVTYLEHSWLQ